MDTIKPIEELNKLIEPVIAQPTGPKRKINWLNIFYPESYTILSNIPLKPLSIGHLLLFEKLNISYKLSNENKNTELLIHDIIMAVLICSRKYKEAAKLLSSGLFRLKYNYIKLKLGLFELEDTVNILNNYFNSHLTNYPESYRNNDQQKLVSKTKPGSPMLLTLINTLLVYYNIPVENIFDINIDMVLWLVAVKAEQEGLLNLQEEFSDDFKELITTLNTDSNAFNEWKKQFGK